MKGSIAALLGAGLMLLSVPAAAQEKNAKPTEQETGEAVAEMMKSMFKVEPLTTEQQTRLPQAQALVARIMPPGTMNQIMGGMFDKFLGPMMSMAGEASSSDVARELGVEGEELELEDEQAAQIAAILDPVWKERREAEMAAMQQAMSTVMTAMEPSMRKGMSEAYAIAFTSAEMTDIDRFFATPSGASFARKSYALASDPRILSASMESLPQMMAQFKVMEEDMKAVSAKFPARRSYADLSPAQRDEIAKATGLSQDEIEAGMARAEAERAKKEAGEDEADEEVADDAASAE